MNPQSKKLTSFVKRILLLIIVVMGSIFLIKGIYALGTQDPLDRERKLKTKNFKDMPLALVAVRNLQSEAWYEELEIELKNVSGKPIYFITAFLVFPDEKLDWGEAGVRLVWGDAKKLDGSKYADPEAPHVAPEKTLVLTIPKMYVKGLRAQQNLRPNTTKNLLLRFEKTYFGDGTGFEVENWWKDFRQKGPPQRVKGITIPPIVKRIESIRQPPPQTQSAVEVIVLDG